MTENSAINMLERLFCCEIPQRSLRRLFLGEGISYFCAFYMGQLVKLMRERVVFADYVQNPHVASNEGVAY